MIVRIRRAQACSLLTVCLLATGLFAPYAAGDTVTQRYTTPGTYTLTVPVGTQTMMGVADGASGASGGGSAGYAGEVTFHYAPPGDFNIGDTLQVVVGAQGGGGGQGGSGNEVGASGGNGGAASTVTDLSSNAVLLAAGGGGGGGGSGGIAGYAGGGGGYDPEAAVSGIVFFPYGGSGSGLGAGGGGADDQGPCGGLTPGTNGGSAGRGTDAGGGGGGGDGYCHGLGDGAGGGSAGGGGGGGGGGGAVGPSYFGGAQGTLGRASYIGDGSVTVTFTPVPPQITSRASLTVPSTSGGSLDFIGFDVTAVGAPTFALSGAPSWLTIDPASGVLSGTVPPRTVKKFVFTITADNGIGSGASQQFTLDVTAPPLTLTAPGTLKGNVTSPFSAKLIATGGIGPYTWSRVSGALPAGLSLGSGGVITGTPTATGTSTFTVSATDSAIPNPASATESVTIAIAARKLTITTSKLASATVGTAYSQSLSAAMGITPLHWSIASGALPGGLSLNAGSGTISGVPTQPGTSSFTVRVQDSTAPTVMTATATLSLTVHPAVQPAVYVVNGNSAVYSFALGASGNVAPLSAIAGSATGLNGTSAVVIDANGLVYLASSNNAEIAEYDYGVTGNVAPSSVIAGSATGLSLPWALALDSAGRLYVANYATASITVYAPGASGDATPVAVISGQHTGLSGPSAMTFDSAGHLWVANFGTSSLTEYPAMGANGDVAPLATIAGSSTGLNGPQGLTLDAAGNLLVANTYGESLTEYKVTDSGNASPLRTISGPVTGLAFPHGLDVDAEGNIYLANVFAGVSEFTPSANGNASPVARISGSVTGLADPGGLAVAPPLSVRTARLPAARVGHRYKALLRANLGTTPYRWALRRGKLPAGIHLSRTGKLTGKPRRRGVYRFTARVRDASHPRMTATRRLVLTVRHR
jgi:large repetitive protein